MLEIKGKEIGIQHLMANISSHNEQSLYFHKKHGFSECGRLHSIGKKKSQNFDVVLVEKEIV